MKKIAIILAGLAVLASCQSKTPETNTGTVSTGTVSTGTTVATPTTTASGSNETIPLVAGEISGPAAENGSKVEMYYILRENDENGKILDTNVNTGGLSVNKLEATIGAGGLIRGFEKNLNGMRAGEVKSFTVQPEDGYGTGTTVTEIDASQLAPEFTRQVPAENLASKNTQTIPLSEMAEEGKKLLEGKKSGDVIIEDEVSRVILISKNETEATLEFHNISSPFYPNEIKAGMTATQSGSTFSIDKIENNMATLRVVTTENPFKKDTYKVGSSAKYKAVSPTGHVQETDVKIIKILPNSVKVEVPNNHELANKVLFFQVKMVKVTPAVNPTMQTATGA